MSETVKDSDIIDFAKGFTDAAELKQFCDVLDSRNSLGAFAKYVTPNYQTPDHILKTIALLERIESGKCRNAMIFYPPRHGKSYLTSQIFPAWFLGRDPRREIIAISYNAEHANKFGRRTRSIVNSSEFKEVFPGVTVSFESQAVDRWELKYTDSKGVVREGGIYQGAGIDGSVTGKGGDLILIDDPIKGHKVADSETFRNSVWNFYQSDLFSRQLKDCRIVLIQTRWHQDDLAGRLLARMEDDTGDQWEILNLPVFTDSKETKTL